MTTYQCRICNETNSLHRITCKSCGTIRREISPVFKSTPAGIIQVESSLHDSGYVETALALNFELSLMRVNPTRISIRNLRTVPLTTYAVE